MVNSKKSVTRVSDPETFLKSMRFDRHGPDALYLQFAERIRAAIRDGALSPGDRLPPVKTCAGLVSLSLATVQRGLVELQDTGEITARQRSGTFIADKHNRQREILICTGGWLPHSFESHMIEAIARSDFDPDAQLMFTCLRRDAISERELLRIVRRRKPSAIIACRPAPTSFNAFRELAERLPVISLINRIPDSKADAICIDASAPTCEALRYHLKAGRTRFACAATKPLLENRDLNDDSPSDSPYVQMVRACRDTITAAGAELTMVIPEDERREGSAEVGVMAAELPSDTVIVAVTPRIVQSLCDAGIRSPIISYTESEASFQQYHQRAMMLYQSIQMIAEEAAAAILGLRPTTGRVVILNPELHHCG